MSNTIRNLNMMELNNNKRDNPIPKGKIDTKVVWERGGKKYEGHIEKFYERSALIAIDENVQRQHKAPAKTVVSFKNYVVVKQRS
ncbi:hypothetical protein [Listeria booriae]|uniref:DUF2187 domain-containing protein n=1 Tax=Listeria booriae TaxID=1552123 RepID=A0A7X0XBI4_9LIST|nr:hypothetical protein [Listeria booriae]MBC1491001.1 hypothetical protein [Listeria booriae]MBC1491084.1 hypothetical protein [Listeria booriae]MBC2258839.1 hypothetical protein [Listeria booriae]MBC2676273.1 hypothetical protein [Listeria booriae]MBC6151083.1 hypothetical protein [Listeria booriae]